jgi:tripartite-type tricarboxylate transporter receptor subunit TctC
MIPYRIEPLTKWSERMRKRRLSLAALLLLTFSSNSSSHAQTEPFYKGKQIKIVVGFTAGGIIDLWARLYTQYMGKYIPGNPDLLVQNVPGGGSMIAANHLFNIAKADGLTLAMISSGLYFDQLIGVKEVQFDWAKFGWIGSPVRNFEVLTMRADTSYRSVEDIQKATQPPRCGTTGTGATGHYFPKFLEEALGAKIQIVLGYPGNRDVEVAIERGEVQCYAITKEAFLREPGRSWLKKGFVRVLVQGGQKRDSLFPETPTIYELMDKHKTPDALKRFASVLLSPGAIGRPLITPPNMPADRIKTLRDAYAKMIADSDLIAEAKKREWEVEYIGGEELESVAKKAVNQTPDAIARLKKILGS